MKFGRKVQQITDNGSRMLKVNHPLAVPKSDAKCYSNSVMDKIAISNAYNHAEAIVLNAFNYRYHIDAMT